MSCNTVVVTQEEIQTVTVASKGVQGPPGEDAKKPLIDAVIKTVGDGSFTIMRSNGEQLIEPPNVSLTANSINIDTDTTITENDSMIALDSLNSDAVGFLLKAFNNNDGVKIIGWDILDSNRVFNPQTDPSRISILVNPS